MRVRKFLTGHIALLPAVSVIKTGDPSITPATLASHDVLIDYYHEPRLGEVAEKAIEDFIKSGKGIVGVHGITYEAFFGEAGENFAGAKATLEGEPWPAFAEMLGHVLEDRGYRRYTPACLWSSVDRRYIQSMLSFERSQSSAPGSG
jgi:hypothetical protein